MELKSVVQLLLFRMGHKTPNFEANCSSGHPLVLWAINPSKMMTDFYWKGLEADVSFLLEDYCHDLIMVRTDLFSDETQGEYIKALKKLFSKQEIIKIGGTSFLTGLNTEKIWKFATAKKIK